MYATLASLYPPLLPSHLRPLALRAPIQPLSRPFSWRKRTQQAAAVHAVGAVAEARIVAAVASLSRARSESRSSTSASRLRLRLRCRSSGSVVSMRWSLKAASTLSNLYVWLWLATQLTSLATERRMQRVQQAVRGASSVDGGRRGRTLQRKRLIPQEGRGWSIMWNSESSHFEDAGVRTHGSGAGTGEVLRETTNKLRGHLHSPKRVFALLFIRDKTDVSQRIQPTGHLPMRSITRLSTDDNFGSAVR